MDGVAFKNPKGATPSKEKEEKQKNPAFALFRTKPVGYITSLQCDKYENNDHDNMKI